MLNLLSKRFFTVLAAGLLSGSLFAAEPPAGFQKLFNGKDLQGWWGLKTEDPRAWMALPADQLTAKKAESLKDIAAHWKAENDELVNDGNGLYLSTEKNYGDFELLLEYKTVPRADSGIYLRGLPQVQIWDSTEEAKFKLGADKGSGGLWNNSPGAPGKDPLVLADKAFGEWNAFRIVMVGERVTIWLNGKLVVDHARLENYFAKKEPKLPVPATGPIQLQTHGGEIRWRNLFIREIAPDEAARILKQGGIDKPSADSGFKSVFNGKDLAGWAGPLENYEVVDGAIQCKTGKGGTLYTAAEYGDFVARLEFLLPPGGNNGLAIRYPGKGDAAYDAMCELQVLDDSAEKYAKLDQRQYHGSAYAMVPAHRGYQWPVGTWNYQEVTVRGSTIVVELNGTRILDCDLAGVTEFMAKRDHPGRDRKSGHFGLAGHNDPVRFRNLEIRPLN